MDYPVIRLVKQDIMHFSIHVLTKRKHIFRKTIISVKPGVELEGPCTQRYGLWISAYIGEHMDTDTICDQASMYFVKSNTLVCP